MFKSKKFGFILLISIVVEIFLVLSIAGATGTEHSVIVDQAGDVGSRASMAIVDGFPAIAYEDGDGNEIKYVRALDSQGHSWETPQTLSLGGSIEQYGDKLELIVVNGYPAIAFYDYDGEDLYFIRAIDAQGTNWGTPICVDCSSDDRGEELSMAIVNGNPAIAYRDYDNDTVLFVRATNATGTAWGAPVLASGVNGSDIEIVIADGRPAIAYFDYDNYNVEYVIADDNNGSAWGTPVVLDNTMGTYDELAMTIVNGNPAVAYYDEDSEVMYYIRASDAEGSGWRSRVVVRANDKVDSYHDLVVIDGYPTIAYQRNSEGAEQLDDDLALIQAADVNGTSWKDPVILLSTGDIGMYNTMISLENGLGVATHDGTDEDLYYFTYVGSVDPDTEPPTVLYGSNTFPSTGSRFSTGPAQITIEFSENITQESAESEENYILIEAGENGTFDTSACSTTIESSTIVDGDGDVGRWASMTLVDGFPAVAYEDHDSDEIKYVRALDAQGKRWGAPQTLDLDDDDIEQYYTKLELRVVNGNPAIAFYDDDEEDLYFIRATDTQGTNWGVPLCVDCSSDDTGTDLSMAVINGNPAIAYQDYDNDAVLFVRATNAAGTAWGTPVLVSGVRGDDVEIVIANGRPAVAYFNHDNYDVEYVLADDINGTSWGTPVILDDSMGDYDELAMAIVNGNPAVVYYDSDNKIMYYIRASNADGASWATRVVVRENDHVGSYHELAVIDGYPTIAYQRNSEELALIQASDVDGTSWKEPRILLSDGDIGYYNSLIALEGNGLGVTSYDDDDENLHYFSYFGSVEPPLIGAAADDTKISVNTASYDDSDPFITTLAINDGTSLPLGTYRLFVCGTTSIEDLSGNKLNGGTSDSPLNFTVQTAAPSLPSTGFRHREVTQLPKQPAAKAYTATAMLLEIPKLGVNMPIIGVPQSEAGWDVTWLGNSAGYLSGSAFPTWAGNTVITGHVWDAYNQPGIFSELKTLKYGDQVQIQAWGMTYTYEVRESKLVTVKNVDAAFQSEEYDWLTLVTCEFYNPFNGEYLFRRAVRAVLISVQ